MSHPPVNPSTTTTNSTITRSPSSKLYFGYGSNLWLQQMRLRCPTSQLIGLSRLRGYKWIINNRGYANVVESPHDEVWGLVFSLPPHDEARLDINEGVPISYTKEMLRAEIWRTSSTQEGNRIDPSFSSPSPQDHEVHDVLVYIDRERLEPDRPRKEYIVRMNHGIRDAVKLGMPEGYVRDVLRSFIPDAESEDAEVRRMAERQAREFEDEEEEEEEEEEG